MSVARRLLLIAALALAAIVLVVAVSAEFAERRVGDAIGKARTTYLLGLVRAAAETNLSFGLQLDQMNAIQSLIEREKLSAPSILAIDIFEPDGHSVYSTDRGALGEPVLPRWVSELERPGIWRLQARGEIIFGTRIENDLGEPAGGVAITVSDSVRIARDLSLRLDLGGLSLLVAFTGIVIAAIVTRTLAHLLAIPFARAIAELSAGGEERPRGRLALAARAARGRWQQAKAAAGRAMQELRAIDHEG